MISNILLALDGVWVIGFDAHDAALDELAFVDDMVRLSGQHALDIVVDIAEDDAIPLATAIRLCSQRFDLKTLQDRNCILDCRSAWVVENGAGR